MTSSKTRNALEDSMLRALRPGRFISYQDGWDFIRTLEDVADGIDDLLSGGEADLAAELYQIFIAACYEKAEEFDDSADNLGEFVEFLFGQWVKARQATSADANGTAETLQNWMADDASGYCLRLENRLVKVLDGPGLAAFEQRARQRLQAARSQNAADARDRWTHVLKVVYAHRGDYDAYLALCDAAAHTPDECETLATICQKQNRSEEALRWVQQGLDLQKSNPRLGGGYGLTMKRRQLLCQLDRENEALEDAWVSFVADPHAYAYKELMRFVPQAQVAAWHDMAMAAVENNQLEAQLSVWVETRETERIRRRLQLASDADLQEVSRSTRNYAAELLESAHPDLAARLYRILGLGILVRGKSHHYGEALHYLERAKSCYQAAAQPQEWQDLVDQLLRQHRRKSSFLPEFKRLVAGKASPPKLSFMERAQSRWRKFENKE